MSKLTSEKSTSNAQIWRLRAANLTLLSPTPRPPNSNSTATAFPMQSSRSMAYLPSTQNATSRAISLGPTLATPTHRTPSSNTAVKYTSSLCSSEPPYRLMTPNCNTVFRPHKKTFSTAIPCQMKMQDTSVYNTIGSSGSISIQCASSSIQLSNKLIQPLGKQISNTQSSIQTISVPVSNVVPTLSTSSTQCLSLDANSSILSTNIVQKGSHIPSCSHLSTEDMVVSQKHLAMNVNSEIFRYKQNETWQNSQTSVHSKTYSKSSGSRILYVPQDTETYHVAKSLSSGNTSVLGSMIKSEDQKPGKDNLVMQSNSKTITEDSYHEKISKLKTCVDNLIYSSVPVTSTSNCDKKVSTVPTTESQPLVLPCISVQGTPMALCPLKINIPGQPTNKRLVALPITLTASNIETKTVPAGSLPTRNGQPYPPVGNKSGIITSCMNQVNEVDSSSAVSKELNTKCVMSTASKSVCEKNHVRHFLPTTSTSVLRTNYGQTPLQMTPYIFSIHQSPRIIQARVQKPPMVSAVSLGSFVPRQGLSGSKCLEKGNLASNICLTSSSISNSCTVQLSTNTNTKKPLEDLNSINKMKFLDNLPPSEALKVATVGENLMQSEALNVTDKYLFANESQSSESNVTDNSESKKRSKPYPVLLVPNINNQKYQEKDLKQDTFNEPELCDMKSFDVIDGIRSSETQNVQIAGEVVVKNEDNQYINEIPSTCNPIVSIQTKMTSDNQKTGKVIKNVKNTERKESFEDLFHNDVTEGLAVRIESSNAHCQSMNSTIREKECQIAEDSLENGNCLAMNKYKSFELSDKAETLKTLTTKKVPADPERYDSFQNQSIQAPQACRESNVLLYPKITDSSNFHGKVNNNGHLIANMSFSENEDESCEIFNNFPLTGSCVRGIQEPNTLRRECEKQTDQLMSSESKLTKNYNKIFVANSGLSGSLENLSEDLCLKLKNDGSNKTCSSLNMVELNSKVCKPCSVYIKKLHIKSPYFRTCKWAVMETGTRVKVMDNSELTTKIVHNIDRYEESNDEDKSQPFETVTALRETRVTETEKGRLTKEFYEKNDKDKKEPGKTATSLTETRVKGTGKCVLTKCSKAKQVDNKSNNEDKCKDKLQPVQTVTAFTAVVSDNCKLSKCLNATQVKKINSNEGDKDEAEHQQRKIATSLTGDRFEGIQNCEFSKYSAISTNSIEDKKGKSKQHLVNAASSLIEGRLKGTNYYESSITQLKNTNTSEDKDESEHLKSALLLSGTRVERTDNCELSKCLTTKLVKNTNGNEVEVDLDKKQPVKTLSSSSASLSENSNIDMKCLMLSLQGKKYVVMVPTEALTDKPSENGGINKKLNSVVMEVTLTHQTNEQLEKPNQVENIYKELSKILSSPPLKQSDSGDAVHCNTNISMNHSINVPEDCFTKVSDSPVIDLSSISSDDSLQSDICESETSSSFEITDSGSDISVIVETKCAHENPLKRKFKEICEENKESNGNYKKANSETSSSCEIGDSDSDVSIMVDEIL